MTIQFSVSLVVNLRFTVVRGKTNAFSIIIIIIVIGSVIFLFFSRLRLKISDVYIELWRDIAT